MLLSFNFSKERVLAEGRGGVRFVSLLMTMGSSTPSPMQCKACSESVDMGSSTPSPMQCKACSKSVDMGSSTPCQKAGAKLALKCIHMAGDGNCVLL